MYFASVIFGIAGDLVVMLMDLSLIIICISSIIFGYRRLLRYLRFFQQEEYSSQRFNEWLKRYNARDQRGSVVCAWFGLIAILVTSYSTRIVLGIAVLSALVLLIVLWREENPLKVGKLPLKMTDRAKRIYIVAVIGYAVFIIISALGFRFLFGESAAPLFLFTHVVGFQTIPYWLMVAAFILSPDEARRQRKFINEAKAKLSAVSPYVIGITGSAGKTSTKIILGRVLSQVLAPTFCPPKSINTVMGITREIRENMRPEHRYAVIEMGAYQRGSITKLCELTPPNAAIITGVGIMHLERFGSEENVVLAKSELAQAVPKCGILVCNGDNAGAREIAQRFHKKHTLLYGLEKKDGDNEGFASWMKDIAVTADGTNFTVVWEGKELSASTKLHGRPALSNVLAVFTMACALGANPEYVLACVAGVEPIDNRLAVKNCGDYLQINDAYNSNPVGFEAALEVLKLLPGKRRVLMTPGMIELGERQFEENKRIGEVASKVCNLVLLIGETNRQALRDGLIIGGFAANNILEMTHRDKALEELAKIRQSGDIVLIENDLPDLYEMDTTF